MDTSHLLEKLEPLLPEKVRRWRRLRETADPSFRELVDHQIARTAERLLGNYRDKVLLSLPSKNKARGTISLGTVLYEKEKWSVGISTAELLQNLAIFGRSGAGKTNVAFHLLQQLTEKKIPFLFLDWKRTARHLLPELKRRANVYTPGRALSPFPFNPFIVPPGLEPNIYTNHLVDIMADAYTLGDGARSILQRAIYSCYEAGNESPSAKNVLRQVEEIPDRQRVSAWKISAIRALESMDFASLSSTEAMTQHELAHKLLTESTIIELDALSQNSKRFLIPILCLWLYYVRLLSPQRETLKLVVFLEEAHHVLYKQSQRARESVMEMLLRQCRELGIANGRD